MITEEIAEQPQSTEALAQALEGVKPEQRNRIAALFGEVEQALKGNSRELAIMGAFFLAFLTACTSGGTNAEAIDSFNRGEGGLTVDQKAELYAKLYMDGVVPQNIEPGTQASLADLYNKKMEEKQEEARQRFDAEQAGNDFAQPTETTPELQPVDTLSEATQDVSKLPSSAGIWTYNIQSGDTVSALLEKANAVVNGQTNVYESRTMGLPQNIAIAIRVGDELVILSNLDEYQQKGAPVIYAGDIALIVDIGQENWQSDLQTYCDQNALTLTK